MSGGAAVIRKQNKLIDLFSKIGAVDEEHAVFIEELGVRRSFVFDRMVARGVFIECEPGKFYIDNEAVHTFIVQRRTRGLIALAAVLLFAVLAYWTGGLK